jgi:hypothetical protein
LAGALLDLEGLMESNELADLLDRPETHRKILDGYCGPYALGVTKMPAPSHDYGFILRVAEAAPNLKSTTVDIDGHLIPVLIQGGFTAPVPY